MRGKRKHKSEAVPWPALAGAALVCLVSAPADAGELVLCNRLNTDVAIVVGIPSPDPNGPTDVRGTYSLGPGACMTAAGGDAVEGVYYVVLASDGHYWTGDRNDSRNAFCIDTAVDSYDRAEQSEFDGPSCPTGQFFAHFLWLDLGNTSQTVDLTPASATGQGQAQ